MKLSDAVSAMQLPIFAEIPLLVFMGVFIGVAIHLLHRRAELEDAADLPLRNELGPDHGQQP